MEKRRIPISWENFDFSIVSRGDYAKRLKTKKPKVIKKLVSLGVIVRLILYKTEHPKGAGLLLTSPIKKINKIDDKKWEILTENSVYELTL